MFLGNQLHFLEPVGDGHFLADEDGTRFRTALTNCNKFDVDSPMHNPLGRLKLVSMRDVAECN